MAYLITSNGPHAGQRYELGSLSVLGRHPDCEIVIDVGAVSRQHAQVVREGQDYILEDLKSRNGTFVNDCLIQSRHHLHDGDVLRVCDVVFTFRHDQMAPGRTMSQALSDLSRKTVPNLRNGTVLIQDDLDEASSTIMSKLDISGDSSGGVQYKASAEAKLNALLEITKRLGKALALDEVLPQVLHSLFKIFVQADRGFIVMRAEDGKLIPLWTQVRHETTNDTIRISRTIVNQVMERQEAVLSADAATDERFEMSKSIADFRIRSMMCAPLIDSEGKSMGVLQIDTLDQSKRFQQDDLAVLASIATQAGIAIDNAQMHENALRQRAIQRDLEVAREVQRSFLPKHPPQLEGYQFFDYYQPAIYVGGDYYDYVRLPDGRIAILVADVVGHGIAAALLMAKLSAEVRFCLASEPHAAAAVTRLNRTMIESQSDRFVTMIMAVLEPATHQVAIVSAGHMAPMHRHADGRLDEPGADLLGFPLGVKEGFSFQQKTITLAPRDILVLYTDGIHECSNANNEMYGTHRIRKLLAATEAESTPRAVGTRIVDEVRRFLAGNPQNDDMCLVCFGRT